MRVFAARGREGVFTDAGTCMSDVLVANVIFPQVLLGIFFVFASLEFHATILINVFFLVCPNAYVILMFVLKGPFIGVFSRHSCSLRQIPMSNVLLDLPSPRKAVSANPSSMAMHQWLDDHAMCHLIVFEATHLRVSV